MSGTQISDMKSKVFIIIGWFDKTSVSNVLGFYSPIPRHIVIIEVITEGGLAPFIYEKSVSHFTTISRSINPKRQVSRMICGTNSKKKSIGFLN